MKNNRGFNAENFMKLFNMRNVVRSYKVFADGDPTPNGDPTPTPNSTPAPVNFEQLIAKAREEEKNKLYPKIKKLEDEISGYVTKHNDDLIAIGTKEKEIETLKKEIDTLKIQSEGNESETVISLKKELKAAQEELQNLKDSAPNVEELTAKIRSEVEAEYNLKLYKQQKIAEANGKIIPELVSGTTEEEINESVEKAVARYNEIVGTATPAPAVNPRVNPANPSNTALKTNEDAMKALLELDPLSKEYAEARKALGFR